MAEPNEANAPEPRPNAEDPPVVGEFKPLPVRGGIALNGFARPLWDEVSPPKRLEAGKLRPGGSCLSLWWSDMERESLLVLQGVSWWLRLSTWGAWGQVCSYFERRVHRFSLASIGDRDG